jgi:hypothetical protein
MLELIVVGTFVGSGKVVLAAELLFAVLAFERQEIDEAAVLSGTLVSDGEESSRRFGVCGHGCGIGIRVRWVKHQGGTGLYTPWSMGHASHTAKSVVTVRRRVHGITSASQNFPPSSRTRRYG